MSAYSSSFYPPPAHSGYFNHYRINIPPFTPFNPLFVLAKLAVFARLLCKVTMSFYIGSGYFPACISNDNVIDILDSDIPPEMSLWEQIKDFFCRTHKGEVLECLYQLCHPPAGTTADDVQERFERLNKLAYPGYENNIKIRPHGLSHFCITDKKGNEVLSVIIADDYTVTTGTKGWDINAGSARSYPLTP